jgi:sialate O-acetylesterase
MNDFLSPFVSNGMIIQRDVSFPVWSKKKISITFLDKTYEAQTKDGKWLVRLDPVQAGGPFRMEIISNGASTFLEDIYAGDLWLCSGQSNMEMQMQRLMDDYSEEWESFNTDPPLIRQLKIPQEWNFSTPCDDISASSWVCASAQTLHDFSATAWFFAKKMYEKHRIPIGLILAAWGGTPIESWMSEEALKDFPGKIKEGKQYSYAQKRNEITLDSNNATQHWETNLRYEDTGLAEQWQNPKTDISAWDEITLPGDFKDAGLTNFCGAIWLAKEFDADADFAAQKARLWLGTIVDADTVYINGVETGNTGYRYPPRKYVPDGLIRQGKNRIVIRVTCNNGEGGVIKDKPFCIFTENQSVELKGIWKYKVGAAAPPRPPDFFFQRQSMGNYNAMIAPVLKYPLKGVIWYQGESNEPNPHEYAQLFKLMIQNWRKIYIEQKTDDGVLPFLFVQLPVFCPEADNNEESRWAMLRQAQASALELPVTGMACALELGEWNDIHPVNKKDVGYRLFLAAEKTVFGTDNTSPGPVLKRTENREQKLYLYFDNCAEGLIILSPESSSGSCSKPYISVIGSEEQFRLPAEIEGKDVISIDVSSVKNPQKILYAWADNPRDRQFFNSDGLPMLPFCLNL